MWKDKTISVVLPAYDEEENIGEAVRDFLSLTIGGDARIVDDLIVVDNNSTDRTAERARSAGARVVRESKQGYGNALQRGLREADGDYIVLCEPDGTFVSADILKLLAYADDFDMVCGTRTTREMIWQEANMGWFLRTGNFAVAKVLEILYGTPSLSDCGCTFRLVGRKARDRIAPHLFVGKSHFLPNMIIAARMTGVSFIEIPLTYRRRVGESKITGTFGGTFRTGFAMIWLVVSMWPAFIARRNT